MKYKISLVICAIGLLLSGCYDREIIEFKPGESIDPVTNLNYTIDGDNITLSWNLPTQYPEDIIQPVSILIKVYEDNILIKTFTLSDAPTSYIYNPYDVGKQYRFIVKVVGDVDTIDPNVSKLRYSLGEFVYID